MIKRALLDEAIYKEVRSETGNQSSWKWIQRIQHWSQTWKSSKQLQGSGLEANFYVETLEQRMMLSGSGTGDGSSNEYSVPSYDAFMGAEIGSYTTGINGSSMVTPPTHWQSVLPSDYSWSNANQLADYSGNHATGTETITFLDAEATEHPVDSGYTITYNTYTYTITVQNDRSVDGGYFESVVGTMTSFTVEAETDTSVADFEAGSGPSRSGFTSRIDFRSEFSFTFDATYSSSELDDFETDLSESTILSLHWSSDKISLLDVESSADFVLEEQTGTISIDGRIRGQHEGSYDGVRQTDGSFSTTTDASGDVWTEDAQWDPIFNRDLGEDVTGAPPVFGADPSGGIVTDIDARTVIFNSYANQADGDYERQTRDFDGIVTEKFHKHYSFDGTATLGTNTDGETVRTTDPNGLTAENKLLTIAEVDSVEELIIDRYLENVDLIGSTSTGDGGGSGTVINPNDGTGETDSIQTEINFDQINRSSGRTVSNITTVFQLTDDGLQTETDTGSVVSISDPDLESTIVKTSTIQNSDPGLLGYPEYTLLESTQTDGIDTDGHSETTTTVNTVLTVAQDGFDYTPDVTGTETTTGFVETTTEITTHSTTTGTGEKKEIRAGLLTLVDVDSDGLVPDSVAVVLVTTVTSASKNDDRAFNADHTINESVTYLAGDDFDTTDNSVYDYTYTNWSGQIDNGYFRTEVGNSVDNTRQINSKTDQSRTESWGSYDSNPVASGEEINKQVKTTNNLTMQFRALPADATDGTGDDVSTVGDGSTSVVDFEVTTLGDVTYERNSFIKTSWAEETSEYSFVKGYANDGETFDQSTSAISKTLRDKSGSGTDKNQTNRTDKWTYTLDNITWESNGSESVDSHSVKNTTASVDTLVKRGQWEDLPFEFEPADDSGEPSNDDNSGGGGAGTGAGTGPGPGGGDLDDNDPWSEGNLANFSVTFVDGLSQSDLQQDRLLKMSESSSASEETIDIQHTDTFDLVYTFTENDEASSGDSTNDSSGETPPSDDSGTDPLSSDQYDIEIAGTSTVTSKSDKVANILSSSEKSRELSETYAEVHLPDDVDLDYDFNPVEMNRSASYEIVTGVAAGTDGAVSSSGGPVSTISEHSTTKVQYTADGSGTVNVQVMPMSGQDYYTNSRTAANQTTKFIGTRDIVGDYDQGHGLIATTKVNISSQPGKAGSQSSGNVSFTVDNFSYDLTTEEFLAGDTEADSPTTGSGDSGGGPSDDGSGSEEGYEAAGLGDLAQYQNLTGTVTKSVVEHNYNRSITDVHRTEDFKVGGGNNPETVSVRTNHFHDDNDFDHHTKTNNSTITAVGGGEFEYSELDKSTHRREWDIQTDGHGEGHEESRHFENSYVSENVGSLVTETTRNKDVATALPDVETVITMTIDASGSAEQILDETGFYQKTSYDGETMMGTVSNLGVEPADGQASTLHGSVVLAGTKTISSNVENTAAPGGGGSEDEVFPYHTEFALLDAPGDDLRDYAEGIESLTYTYALMELGDTANYIGIVEHEMIEDAQFWGMIQVFGGVIEVIGGVTVAATMGATVAGGVAGGVMILHGLDTIYAGSKTWATGEASQTFTAYIGGEIASGINYSLTGQQLDESTKRVFGEVLDIGVSFIGPGAVAKVAKVGSVSKSFSSVGRMVTKGKNALKWVGQKAALIAKSDKPWDTFKCVVRTGKGCFIAGTPVSFYHGHELANELALTVQSDGIGEESGATKISTGAVIGRLVGGVVVSLAALKLIEASRVNRRERVENRKQKEFEFAPQRFAFG